MAQSGIFDILASEDNSIKLDDDELLVSSVFIGFKKIALAVADNNIKVAIDLYENYVISELFEWYTIKLAANYRQQPERK